MPHIVRPITDDGLVGYDEYNQLSVTKKEKGCETSWFIADVRDKTCAICAHGWEPNSISMADQFHWDVVEGYVHRTCLDRHRGIIERGEFYNALVAARVRFEGLKTIPNEYHGPSMKERPWYTAELLDYPVMFKLGARKRVDHIEVIPLGDVKLTWCQEAEKAFETENVTKHFRLDSVLLHAYTPHDVRSYIARLAEVGKLNVRKDE